MFDNKRKKAIRNAVIQIHRDNPLKAGPSTDYENTQRARISAIELQFSTSEDRALAYFFLDRLQMEEGSTHLHSSPFPGIEPKVDDAIDGRYKLVSLIAEGGMGAVWWAIQKAGNRKVAVKLIKRGKESPRLLRSFEKECTTLAALNHPNIAAFYDGGTHHNQPYFAMEFVAGVAITDYCNDKRLPLRERLNLFIVVCQAVQYANQRLVVHLDLKPSNILVCQVEDKPVPKIVDFGLAKVLDHASRNVPSQRDDVLIGGTFRYMSPEQATPGWQEVSTLPDIYSLGVVLYELLTGTTPLAEQQLRELKRTEILRIIREVVPPHPSEQVCNSPQSAMLAGELDWIVMKALSKDPAKRYQSADAFANDIRLYLEDEIIRGCPRPPLTRLRKYIKRHRFAASLLAVLALGVICTTTSMLFTRMQRNRAESYLVGGWLRTIGRNRATLTTEELLTFKDWSAASESRLKLLALETALDDPEQALSVARRAEHVIQAAVGLSPHRRSTAISLMSRKQRDGADNRIRIAACWFALELGSDDLPAFNESVEYLSHSQNNATPRLAEFLTCARCKLESEQGAILVASADTLIAAMDDRNADVVCPLCETLVLMAPRLTEKSLVRGWKVFNDVVRCSLNHNVVTSAGEGLAAFAPHLSADVVHQSGDMLLELLPQSRSEDTSRACANGIVALGSRLNPAIVSRQVDMVVMAIEKRKPDQGIAGYVYELRALEKYLNASSRKRVCESLVAIAPESTESRTVANALNGLLAFVPYEDKATKARCGRLLVATIRRSSDSTVIAAVARGLAVLGPEFDREIVESCGECIVARLESPMQDGPFRELAEALSTLDGLPGRSDPARIIRGWKALVAVLETSRNDSKLDSIGPALSALASGLDQQSIALGWESLVKVLNTKGGAAQRAADQGLTSLGARLKREHVRGQGELFVELLENATTPDQFRGAVNCFALLVPHIELPLVDRGKRVLVDHLRKTTDTRTIRIVGKGLVKLSKNAGGDSATVGLALKRLLDLFEASTDSQLAGYEVDGITDLISGLSQGQIVDAIDRLSNTLSATKSEIKSELCCRILASILRAYPKFAGERAEKLLTQVLDGKASKSGVSHFQGEFHRGHRSDSGAFNALVMSVRDQRVLARFLSHPGCVATIRTTLLERLEELVLHEGRSVLLKLESEISVAKTTSLPTDDQTVSREFQSVHDASRWIGENWPDFDLEVNHPIAWKRQK